MEKTFIVSFDDTSGDIPVLLVGVKKPDKVVEIINFMKGDRARELYKQLTTVVNEE